MLTIDYLSNNFPNDLIRPYNSVVKVNTRRMWGNIAVIRATDIEDFSSAMSPHPGKGILTSRRIYKQKGHPNNTRWFPGEIQYIFRVKKWK